LFLKGDEDRKKLSSSNSTSGMAGGRRLILNEEGCGHPKRWRMVGKLLKGNSEFALIDDQ